METGRKEHKFNSFDRPMLTDSGGFQVFSLAREFVELRERRCNVSIHIDGSRHVFTPEKVMDIETNYRGRYRMAFDECPPGDFDYEYAKSQWDLRIVSSMMH